MDPETLLQLRSVLQVVLQFLKEVFGPLLATGTYFLGQWYERRKINQQHTLQARLDLDNARRNRETDMLMELIIDVERYSTVATNLLITAQSIQTTLGDPALTKDQRDRIVSGLSNQHMSRCESFIDEGSRLIRLFARIDLLGISSIQPHLHTIHRIAEMASKLDVNTISNQDWKKANGTVAEASLACNTTIVAAYNQLWDKPTQEQK